MEDDERAAEGVIAETYSAGSLNGFCRITVAGLFAGVAVTVVAIEDEPGLRKIAASGAVDCGFGAFGSAVGSTLASSSAVPERLASVWAPDTGLVLPKKLRMLILSSSRPGPV